MKEIGGYLEFEAFAGREYYQDSIALNTARNALAYLAKAKNIRKIYIPYFLCNSVSGVCDREGIPYEYYHIDADFKLVYENSLQEDEWLYVVNFYGQLKREDVIRYKERYGCIIIDNVQAFFEKPLNEVDTIYSCRKFFGVPDGAYLVSDCTVFDIDIDSSKDRMKHLLGRYEGRSASEYYSDFKANDHSFVAMPVRYMSRITHNILGAIDYDKVIKRRNDNRQVLHDILGDMNKLRLNMSDGPYMYPFYCANGMDVKKKLAQKKIFIPTLWPNVLDFDGCEIEKDYAQNILPLPCDQRYDLDDMLRVAEEVKKCIN